MPLRMPDSRPHAKTKLPFLGSTIKTTGSRQAGFRQRMVAYACPTVQARWWRSAAASMAWNSFGCPNCRRSVKQTSRPGCFGLGDAITFSYTRVTRFTRGRNLSDLADLRGTFREELSGLVVLPNAFRSKMID